MAKTSADRFRWMRRLAVGRRRRIGLWARSHRIALVVLETAAGVAIVAGIAVGLFLWQLSKGDISVSFLTGPVERAVNAHLSGYTVSVADTVLERTSSGAGISVRLKRLRLYDSAGNTVAEAPKAAIGVSLLPLLTGRVVPSRVDLIGPRVAVVYGADGRITIDLEAPDHARLKPGGAPKGDRQDAYALAAATVATEPDAQAGTDADAAPSGSERNVAFLRALIAGRVEGGFAALDEIGIKGATAVFVHERLDRRWEVSGGTFVLARRGGELTLSAEAGIGHGGRSVPMSASATVRVTADGIEIVGSVRDFVPRLLAQGVDQLGPLAAFDLPVMAEFSGRFLDDGTLSGGSFTALLGAGHVRPAGEGDGILIDEGALRLTYDAATRRVTMAPSEFYSGRTHIRLTGTLDGPPLARPAEPGGAASDVWRYSIEARDVLLGSADVREEPMPVDRISASGSVDLASGALRLDRGELAASDATLTLTGALLPAEGSPELTLSATFLPMSVKALKGIWPAPVAPGARRWVARNFRNGTIAGGSFRAHFPPGLLAEIGQGRPLPDAALQLEFRFADITTSYLDEMPYIRGGSGSARILGDRFELVIDGGHVDISGGKRLTIRSGGFSIPSITAAVPHGTIRLDFSGAAGDLVALLDHEPLGYPRRAGIGRGDFTGRGEVSLRLDLPLIQDVLLADVRIAAEAEIAGFAGKGAFAGRDIADGVMLFTVKDEIIAASGEVLVEGRPALIVWRRPFEPSAADPSRLLVRMTLDDAGRRALGLDFPHVTGPVQFEFEPRGGFGKGEGGPTRVAANLRLATITPTPFGWDKPRGVPADVSFEVSGASGKGLVLDRFALDSDGAKVRGRVVLARDGSLETVRLPTFRLEAGDDMSLSADRIGPRRLHVKISGRSFDGRELLAGLVRLNDAGPAGPAGNGEAGKGEQVVVDADFEQVVGHGETHLTGVHASIVTLDGTVTRMDIAGRLGGRAPLRATISPADGASTRNLRIDAADAGAALRFSGFYPRAEGGSLLLMATLPADETGSTTGLLKVADFRIRSDPVLETISEAAARGRNAPRPAASYTQFDRLRVPFSKRPGQIQLAESVLRGPTLGATMSGAIDFNAGSVALGGTFIPAYVLNNLIARVPVIGQVLAGGEEQGIVGINYTITGTTGEPRVLINPLSVATPGILRRIFEIGQPSSQFASPDGRFEENTGSLPGPANPLR